MELRGVLHLLSVGAACAALAAGATVAQAGGPGLRAILTGAAEVPGPGDADGNGTLTVTPGESGTQLCIDLSVSGIAAPTAAHIHKGAAGSDGAPVVPLPTPTGGHAAACVDADPAVVAAILADPAGYYVNVHTADFPKGAIRGQLSAQ